jgi:hypothetical protein
MKRDPCLLPEKGDKFSVPLVTVIGRLVGKLEEKKSALLAVLIALK